jgi:hypothetical protein
MENMRSFESFLEYLGPLAVTDRADRLRRAVEEAPEFCALSFFTCRETLVSRILAYLLNPYADHGQGKLFLRMFLTALELKCNEPQAVVVLTEFPIKAPTGPRPLDLLIRFTDDSVDNVIVIESKSHFAGDQPYQIRDYLRHLRTAYPSTSRRKLYYLKDGGEPSKMSIATDEWSRGVEEGICLAKSFRDVFSSWRLLCQDEDQVAPKLACFLDDFAVFADMEAKQTMLIKGAVLGAIEKAIDTAAGSPAANASDLDAVLAIYASHKVIWERSILASLTRVQEMIMRHLPGWQTSLTSYSDEKESGCEFVLWKEKWLSKAGKEPDLCVVLATVDSLDPRQKGMTTWGPAHFDMVIKKSAGLEPGTIPFNDQNKLLIGPGKNQFWHRAVVGGIEDIRSADGIRYLLAPQGIAELAQRILVFVGDHENEMDGCFGSINE